MTVFCAACSSAEPDSFATNTPSFVTATLPPTFLAQPTQTLFSLSTSPAPTSPAPTNLPSEGATTTQINVRAETTTASQSLGVIPVFTKIQIIGKESSGNWFKIIYDTSTGWVRAEFVQVDSSVQIAVVEIESGGGSGRSGVVISGINIRSGAGTHYQSIGVLTPKDVVSILGKDTSGAWMQIKFQGNIGWVAAEFLQIENVAEIPIIEALQNTPIAPVINETPLAVMQIANVDNDSIQSPFAILFFNENTVLQITGEVSAPQGDNEDWVEISSASSKILIEGSCSKVGIQVELWQTSEMLENFSSICENEIVFDVSENESYTFKIYTSETGYIQYSLKFKVGN